MASSSSGSSGKASHHHQSCYQPLLGSPRAAMMIGGDTIRFMSLDLPPRSVRAAQQTRCWPRLPNLFEPAKGLSPPQTAITISRFPTWTQRYSGGLYCSPALARPKTLVIASSLATMACGLCWARAIREASSRLRPTRSRLMSSLG